MARVASSSRRMPAIRPSKPYLVSAHFSPSVLRAAERAAGGKVGSTASIGGQGSILRSRSHSLPKRSRNAYISGKFLAGVDVQRRERHAAEEGLARQPDHHVGILPQRPQQRELFQPRERLPQNVDALRLELVEVVHRGRRQAVVGQNFRHGGCFGEGCGPQPVSAGFIVEKMHLCALDFGSGKILKLRCNREEIIFSLRPLIET